MLMISTWYHGLEAALNIETDLAGLSSQNTVQVGYLLLNNLSRLRYISGEAVVSF